MKKVLQKDTVIFIVGPTAIGKTGFAIKLARKIKGEIISCDSMQIYKGMALLSQAPSEKEKRSVRHYLVESLSPVKEYSVASFRNKATRAIRNIIRRKKIPIIVGGSGLYIKALIDGLFPAPEADLKFRANMAKFVDRYGSGKLHERLEAIDPDSAKSIHPNDVRRIIRSLEIYQRTGLTMTELKSRTKGLKDKYEMKIFGLTAPREIIYNNIDKRVDLMFKMGVINEVKKLSCKRLSKTANMAIGLKEISAYINGNCALDEAKDLMKMNTRRFAKRQLTWFRADKRIVWLDVTRLSQADMMRRVGRAAC